MGEFVTNRFSHILFICFRNLLLAFYLLLYGISDYLFVYLSTYYFTTIQNMQTDNERYKKWLLLHKSGGGK